VKLLSKRKFTLWWPFLGLHLIWWAIWFLVRVEPFPYGFLTMVLSLEAIVLSTLILIVENKQGDRDRAQLALDRVSARHVEKIAEHIEKLEQQQFRILHHLEKVVGPEKL